MSDTRRTLAEEVRYALLDLQLIEMEREWQHTKRKREFVPADWRRIERDVPVRAHRTRITAAFDKDVVKWFRAMGHGYQARMNAVLRTYMLAMVSKEIQSRANTNWKGEAL